MLETIKIQQELPQLMNVVFKDIDWNQFLVINGITYRVIDNTRFHWFPNARPDEENIILTEKEDAYLERRYRITYKERHPLKYTVRFEQYHPIIKEIEIVSLTVEGESHAQAPPWEDLS